jgi:glycosyltransferase involved in cell wall biosynthesis
VKSGDPLVSIITITFNSAQTLEQTICSVLNQTYDPIEHIIIDGGSTDGTLDVIKQYDKQVASWISEDRDQRFLIKASQL